MNENYQEDYETVARREKKSIPYEIFKGMGGKHGALALDLREAYTSDPSRKPTGIIFLNMTPTEGKNQYNWNKKISMALNLSDLADILLYLKSPSHPHFEKNDNSCFIIHDRGMNSGKERGQDTSTLNINKPSNMNNFFFNMTKKQDGEIISKVSVPISVPEALVITSLIETAIPAMLSWSGPTKPLKK